MSDRLDVLKDTYAENLISLDRIHFAINEAVMAIPDLTAATKLEEEFGLET